MKKNMILIFLVCIICNSCANNKSPLADLDIQIGMKRSEVENMIDQALNTKNEYSAYGNNLEGGIVKYINGHSTMEIKYKAGAPAPIFVNNQDNEQGLPPIEETVESINFYKNNR